jgi:hypothetical protein
MVKGLCVKPNKGDAVLFWSMVRHSFPLSSFRHVVPKQKSKLVSEDYRKFPENIF